jgi:hypothetical protein
MKRACVETKEKSHLKRRETKCRRQKKKRLSTIFLV